MSEPADTKHLGCFLEGGNIPSTAAVPMPAVPCCSAKMVSWTGLGISRHNTALYSGLQTTLTMNREVQDTAAEILRGKPQLQNELHNVLPEHMEEPYLQEAHTAH